MKMWYISWGFGVWHINITKRGHLNYDDQGFLRLAADLFPTEKEAYLEKIRRAKKEIKRRQRDIIDYEKLAIE